jgi:ABC-type Na+ transport system ATPase subunit NatA
MGNLPIISATNVVKTYRSRDVVVHALNDVTFEVKNNIVELHLRFGFD